MNIEIRHFTVLLVSLSTFNEVYAAPQPQPSQECRLEAHSIGKQTATADIVFEGKMVDYSCACPGITMSGPMLCHATVNVTKAIKGTMGSTVSFDRVEAGSDMPTDCKYVRSKGYNDAVISFSPSKYYLHLDKMASQATSAPTKIYREVSNEVCEK